MTSLNVAPFVPFRQFDSNGLLLTGGKIFFYRAGTNTPQETFQDAAGTIANSNPVILDSSGVAKIYLLPAKYKIVIYDADDVLIHEQDEIGTGGGSSATLGGAGSIGICTNYEALRNLSEDFDAILVLGRNVAGDGGQGWFYKSTSTNADDDAVLLVRQSTTRYMRDLNGYIDPLWSGVQYNVANDQFNALGDTLGVALQYKLPIVIADNLYLQTNITFPIGTRLIINGSFYGPSGSPPTLTFADGAVIESCSYAGIRLPVVLGIGCVRDAIQSSWFGGGDDTELARISAITSEYTLNINKSYAPGLSISIPKNLKVDFIGGAKFNISSAGINISIAKLIYNGNSQIINYSNISYIAGVNLGTACRPEWFGAVGDGVANDTLPMQASIKSTVIALTGRYLVNSLITTTSLTVYGTLEAALSQYAPLAGTPDPAIVIAGSGNQIAFTSAGQLAINSASIHFVNDGAIDTNGGNLAIKNGIVYGPNSGKIKATYVAAQDSVFSQGEVLDVPSDTDVYMDNCRIDTSLYKRYFRQFSAFKDIYLENIKKTTSIDRVLTTDADGKVLGTGTLTLDNLTVNNLVSQAEQLTNVTFIEFESFVNFGGVVLIRTKRNGVQIAESTSTPASWDYQIRTDDKPTIVVKYSGVGAITTYIVPRNRPSNSDVIRVISIGPGRVFVGNGGVTPTPCWNAFNVELNGDAALISNNRMSCNGFYYSGKWSIG
jgi:hypothetical protein